jgi:hypothetical protein
MQPSIKSTLNAKLNAKKKSEESKDNFIDKSTNDRQSTNKQQKGLNKNQKQLTWPIKRRRTFGAEDLEDIDVAVRCGEIW